VFVILAIAKDRAAVIKRLENEGFVKGRDFLQRTDLCPVTPSIEISGVCNLKCLACPRSDTLHPFENGDFMNIDNYKKIIDKLVKEMPMLHMVGLQIWGDPLLHPKLPEILKINSDLGIVTDISTNLNIRTEKLEEIVKANPTYIRLSCSGFGSKHYEITHAGAKWELFYKNCAELSMLIKKYHVDTTVEIYFHINKMNIDEYKDIYSLVRQMGFRLNAVLSMIFPKYAMDFLKNIPLHDGAQKSKDLMWISLEEMLDSAQKDNAKPCPQRIGFPNINWDRSVLNCCNLTQDRLAGDFMNITLDELIKLKNNSDFCKECISYSLHRYVDLVKYMPYVQNLLLEKCNLPYYI
jgi:MoaA/NifB/PqqE/SkfB family radical SAM enzyme